MIRKFGKSDHENVMQIWLYSNINAHSFIPDEYWRGKYSAVKKMLPYAEVYVYEADDVHEVQGFIGLTDNYIAGIFVKEEVRSRGIGRLLLDRVKRIKDSLELSVYQKNMRAVSFYQREDFLICAEKIDDETGEKEFLMKWSRKPQ